MFKTIAQALSGQSKAVRSERAEFYREWDRALSGAFSPRERAEINAIFGRHAERNGF